jgi:hypothetical protein
MLRGYDSVPAIGMGEAVLFQIQISIANENRGNSKQATNTESEEDQA